MLEWGQVSQQGLYPRYSHPEGRAAVDTPLWRSIVNCTYGKKCRYMDEGCEYRHPRPALRKDAPADVRYIWSKFYTKIKALEDIDDQAPERTWAENNPNAHALLVDNKLVRGLS